MAPLGPPDEGRAPRPPFDPLQAILWLLAAMVGTACVIALVGSVNCFLYERTCQMPLLREFAGELLAALMGIYAGSRGRPP
jgi:hypothetical protein